MDEADALADLHRGAGETVEVKAEDRNQITTAADHAIGRSIIAAIHRDFPADSVIEEESGVRTGSGPVTWIIDPLDGTSNYAAGSPLYGAMLAAVDEQGLLAAGISLPARCHGHRRRLRRLPAPQLPYLGRRRTGVRAHGERGRPRRPERATAGLP
nr:inositol monophosphatase family protein [Streptomyces sp. SID10815]